MIKKKEDNVSIAIIGLLAFFGIAIYISVFHPADYDKHGIITEGTVYETGRGGNSDAKLTLRYLYYVNGEERKASNTYQRMSFAVGERFVGKKFLVMYIGNSFFERSRILVNRDDFNKARLPFPDSLSWVEEISH